MELFNEIGLKVGEHKYIYIFGKKNGKKIYIYILFRNGGQNMFCDIAQ